MNCRKWLLTSDGLEPKTIVRNWWIQGGVTGRFFLWVILPWWNGGTPHLKGNLRHYLVQTQWTHQKRQVQRVCNSSKGTQLSAGLWWDSSFCWLHGTSIGALAADGFQWVPNTSTWCCLQGQLSYPKTTLPKHTFQGTAINKVNWELTRTFPLCSNAKTYNWESSLGAQGPWVLLAGLLRTTLPSCSLSPKWEGLGRKPLAKTSGQHWGIWLQCLLPPACFC